MKRLLLIYIALAALAPAMLADDKAAIIAATKSYVAANSGMTKVTVTVEQVADDFARAKVAPDDAKATDPAWVFLKKKDGKWTGVTLGTSFTNGDYPQLGLPN